MKSLYRATRIYRRWESLRLLRPPLIPIHVYIFQLVDEQCRFLLQQFGFSEIVSVLQAWEVISNRARDLWCQCYNDCLWAERMGHLPLKFNISYQGLFALRCFQALGESRPPIASMPHMDAVVGRTGCHVECLVQKFKEERKIERPCFFIF